MRKSNVSLKHQIRIIFLTNKTLMKKYTTTDTSKADAMLEDYISGLSAVQISIKYQVDWQQEQDKKLYSEEEVKDLIDDWTKMANGLNLNFPKDHFNKWFEKIKKK